MFKKRRGQTLLDFLIILVLVIGVAGLGILFYCLYLSVAGRDIYKSEYSYAKVKSIETGEVNIVDNIKNIKDVEGVYQITDINNNILFVPKANTEIFIESNGAVQSYEDEQ